MTNPTPMNELWYLSQRIANGTATPGDKERASVLQNRIVGDAVAGVARAMRDAQPQIDAALARRRAAAAAARWRAQQLPRRR